MYWRVGIEGRSTRVTPPVLLLLAMWPAQMLTLESWLLCGSSGGNCQTANTSQAYMKTISRSFEIHHVFNDDNFGQREKAEPNDTLGL